MEMTDIFKIIREITTELINKEYQAIYDNDADKLLTVSEIQLAVEEYPGQLTEGIYQESDRSIHCVEITPQHMFVDFDLFYDGKWSDLTVSMDVKEVDGRLRYSINNIHVM